MKHLIKIKNKHQRGEKNKKISFKNRKKLLKIIMNKNKKKLMKKFLT